MNRLTIALLLTAIITMSGFAQKQPDFAFPKTVSKNAATALARARAAGNDTEALRALIDLTVADGLVDIASVRQSLDRIEDFGRSARTPQGKALAQLLEARVYYNIYQSRSGIFNRRSLPLEPLPGDFNEWSGDQFRQIVSEYIDKALTESDALKGAKLSDYSSVIQTDRISSIYYPTLFDFAVWQAIDLTLGMNYGSSRFMPASLLDLWPECAATDLQYVAKDNARVMRYYYSLLEFHDGHSAPFINTESRRLLWVNSVMQQAGSYRSQSERSRLFESLRQLFDANRQSEYSGDVLNTISNSIGSNEKSWLYDHCIDNIAKFPTYYNINCLHNIVARLSNKSADISYPLIVAPGEEMEVKVRSMNVDDLTVTLHSVTVPDDVTSIPRSRLTGAKTVAEMHVKVDRRVPFECDTVIKIKVPNAGRYVVTADYANSGDRQPLTDLQLLTASNLLLGINRYATQQIMVVDALSGRPIDGANVSFTASYPAFNGKIQRTATTNVNGMADYNPEYAVTGVASSDGMKSAPVKIFPFNSNDDSDNDRVAVTVLTSLALYHPGDSVQWAAVAIGNTKDGRSPVASKKFSVTAYDANYQQIYTRECVTDNFGRIEGALVIPEGNLTGVYHLEVQSAEGYAVGTCHFTVSDYKLPTFEITVNKALIDYPTKGDVTLRGCVKAYSGFALADVAVNAELSVSRRWFYWDYVPSVAFYSAPTVMTDPEGNFEILLPRSLMEQSPITDGYYSVEFTATAQTGETQQTSSSFTTTPRYGIMLGSIDNLDVSKPLTLPIKVVDNEGAEQDATVDYEVSGPLGIAARGTLKTSDPVVNWKDIPGGCYKLSFHLPESTDTVTAGNVCIFRPTDHYSPSSSLLWTPAETIKTDSARKVPVIIGTSSRRSEVLVTLWDDNNYFSQRWISLPRGLNKVDIDLPTLDRKINATFLTVNKLKMHSVTVEIVPEASVKGIRLTATSFRDKITPGQNETWTFSVRNLDGTPAPAALMFDMYNKALDHLASQHWSLEMPWRSSRHFNASFGDINSTGGYYVISPLKTKNCVQIIQPEFNTYGYPLYSLYSRSVHAFKESKMMLASAPMANATTDKLEEVMVEEVADDMGATAVTGSGVENESAPGESNADNSYRPSEIALALFRPMLTTDADGNLTFSFTAPNANTTWQFYAIAFNGDGQAARMAREIVSSKPLMVQPNLPRFLRVGDDAEIRAMVMNNSDSDRMTTTTVELFNPADNSVILSHTFTSEIAAGRSETFAINTGTIAEMPMIGYRVCTAAEGFSDGEQAAIPVLSTISPVIETKPFYSSPDQTVIRVNIPKAKGDESRFTLQFCENPLWTVVTALPGLRQSKPLSSTEAAEAIYSAAVATHLLKKNPEIATALRQWTASDRSDSTLTSLLSRNSDLKTLLLQATPWMVDAMNDTERMTRLALLFDRGEVNRAVNGAVDVLAKAVSADGGWSWSPANGQRQECSTWATLRILSILGELKAIDALPDNQRLRRMIEPALKCIDKVIGAEYAKRPSGDYTEYTYVRSMFPDVQQSTAAKRVTAAAVQSIIGNWKRYSTERKAIAAIILNRNNYRSTASELLKSLREYAIISPTEGMTWKSASAPYGSVYSSALVLSAFAQIEPTSADIDRIRQWLILQKEALNWGNSVATTAAVNAILSTSQRWIRPAHDARFYLGSDEFVPQQTPEQFSGYLRTSLPAAEAAGATLTVVKSADTPAYGAVYCRYRAEMADIKAVGCDAVTIEKNTYAMRDGKWVAAEQLAVGERVKVELLIHANRDMDYVAITDDRAACLEPAEQLPGPVYSEGIMFYRENLDASTRLFIDRLPRGTYRLSYELFVNNSGRFTTGIATIQSQMAPQLTAHSAGMIVTVNN